MIGTFTIIGTNLIILSVFYIILKSKINKSLKSTAVLEQIRKEINKLIVELNQTTERNISLIENRVTRLNEILEKADKRIKVLNREVIKTETGKELYSNLSLKIPANPVKEKTNIKIDKNDMTKREEVMNYFHKGIDPKIIASRTGFPVGEVELIISLAKGKG